MNQQQRAIEDLKKAIIAAPALILFDPARESFLVCDDWVDGRLFQKTQHRSTTRVAHLHTQKEDILKLAVEFATSCLQFYPCWGKLVHDCH